MTDYEREPLSKTKIAVALVLLVLAGMGFFSIPFDIQSIVSSHTPAPAPHWNSLVNGTISNVGFEAPNIFTVVVIDDIGNSHFLFPTQVTQNLVVGGCYFVYQNANDLTDYKFVPCIMTVTMVAPGANV